MAKETTIILKNIFGNKEIEVPCPMQQIEELLRNQTGFKVKEHNLTLKGICEECINNKKK